jgi:hypothetical protein
MKKKIIMPNTNCFVSYHHERDGGLLDEFRELKKGTTVSDWSLKDDIGHLTDETIYNKVRQKMYKCSVTIVLIGERTGHRKWIDWEIWASLRPYAHPNGPIHSFKPNALVGIYLPVSSYSVPDRLQDNIDSKYAVTLHWCDIEKKLDSKIAKALENREKSHRIDNSRERQGSDYKNFLGFKIKN